MTMHRIVFCGILFVMWKNVFLLCSVITLLGCDMTTGPNYEKRIQTWKGACAMQGYRVNTPQFKECMIISEADFNKSKLGGGRFGSRLESWHEKCTEYGYTPQSEKFSNCIMHQERKYQNSIIKWH